MPEYVRRALVVDDSRTMGEIMSKLLRQAGFADVHSVESGAAALECMAAASYELVLCDLEMSPMDGKQLAARIRANRAYNDTKLVITTANAARIAEEMSNRSLQADGYILKPFTAEKLKSKLNEIATVSR